MPIGLTHSHLGRVGMSALPSHPPIKRVRGHPEGIETGPKVHRKASSPPEDVVHRDRDCAFSTPITTTTEKVFLRLRKEAAPRRFVNLCVESRESQSFTVQAPRLDLPLRIMTTDPVSLLPQREESTTSLVGTPCGLGNPGDRGHLKAWGRPMSATEINADSATWGRSLSDEISNYALKVWTWGRTTKRALLDVELRRGCSGTTF